MAREASSVACRSPTTTCHTISVFKGRVALLTGAIAVQGLFFLAGLTISPGPFTASVDKSPIYEHEVGCSTLLQSAPARSKPLYCTHVRQYTEQNAIAQHQISYIGLTVIRSPICEKLCVREIRAFERMERRVSYQESHHDATARSFAVSSPWRQQAAQ